MNEHSVIKRVEKACIVDLNNTLIKPVYLEQGLSDTYNTAKAKKNQQKFYCKCGHVENLSVTVKRNLIINEDLSEDDESIGEIICSSCKEIYHSKNPILFILPNSLINFSNEFSFFQKPTKDGKQMILQKKKTYVLYDKNTEKITLKEKIDFISFNPSSKKAYIYVEAVSSDEDKIHLFDKMNPDGGALENKEHFLYEEVGLGKIGKLENFFKFSNYVSYYGFEQIYNFLTAISPFVSDVEKMMHDSHFQFFKEYSENIQIETINKGDHSKKVYTVNLKRKFGINKTFAQPLNVGNYLYTCDLISKIYFSVISFPNLTTILLTKNFDFFYALIKSNNICHSYVYKTLKVTDPMSISEVTSNLNKHGVSKESSNNGESSKGDSITEMMLNPNDIIKDNSKYTSSFKYKISPTIYNSLKKISDLERSYNAILKNVITKQDLELLLQKHSSGRLYDLMELLTNNRNENKLTLKHINHIIDNSLDIVDGSPSSENIHLYFDTINTIKLLNFSPKTIFDITNKDELKQVHDDLAVKYSTFRDAKKAELYIAATKLFEHLNETLHDISFTVLSSLDALNREGQAMSHCVYTYLDRICDRKYLAVHVQHTISNEKATMGLILNGEKLKFEQLKGYQNSRATHEMINTVRMFLDKHKIDSSHVSCSDLNPDLSLEKKMKDYLTTAELAEIRKKRHDENKKLLKTKKTDVVDNEPIKKVKKPRKFLFF
jgi:hypothetical protein